MIEIKMSRESVITLLVILGVSQGLLQEDVNRKAQQQQCPTWFIPEGNHTGDCKCGVQTFFSTVIVKCDETSNQSMLASYTCMTYNESTGVTIVGLCPYNSHKTDSQELYMKLPQNVARLDDFMCGVLNRTGPLCSHCMEGLGIPVFSYVLHCLPCLESSSGWLLYIFLAVFPTTIFFLIVIIFQVRVTSAPMNAFIFACQVSTNWGNFKPYIFLNVSPIIHILTIVLSTVYGFWNLDFFRYVIPSFCVSDQLTPIKVIALEYIVAFYPLLLIVITYICVELYARDCRLIEWLWRPCRRCLAFVLRGMELNFLFVDAFASFLLLSFSKILFVSFQLLVAINLYNATGQMISPNMVYYDASIEYLSVSHLPFALLAICVLCVFVVLPALVLLLYPTRAFQRCLGCCRVRWHALHAFADTFNGYYKNGTEGTRDYRYFAGLYMIFRILLAFPMSHDLALIGTYYRMITIICCSIASLLFAILRPYKRNWINIWDSVVFAILALSLFWEVYTEYVVSLPLEFIGVIATVPLIYIFLYVLIKHKSCFQKCSVFMKKYRTYPQLEPDRLLNPEEYRHLLPRTDSSENEHSNTATRGSRDGTYPACGNSLQGFDSAQ